METQTALYSATTGRNGGANIQLITRVGTKEFHGACPTSFSNEIFNANEFFLNRQAEIGRSFGETRATPASVAVPSVR